MNGSSSAAGTFKAPIITPKDRIQTGFSTIHGDELHWSWRERNLLSLDGGGIRGYWTLLVLERLMEAIGKAERKAEWKAKRKTEKEAGGETEQHTEEGSSEEYVPTAPLHSFDPEQKPDNVTQCVIPTNVNRDRLDAYNFLPCHYFDVICGSSTGGLIAIMLCRFRMTVKDCLEEYAKMSSKIFGNPRIVSKRNTLICPWTKYSGSAMKKVFKEVTQRRASEKERNDPNEHGYVEPKLPTSRGTCSMFVTTFRSSKGGTAGTSSISARLRSYSSVKIQEGRRIALRADKMKIWEVARAATAAPFYFPELCILSDDAKIKTYYTDGGVGISNNPTMDGIEEIKKRHPNENIGTVLSIGTARAANQADGYGALATLSKMIHKATDPEVTHEMVSRYDLPNYCRLNLVPGLDVQLDEWKPNLFSKQPGNQTIDKLKAGFAVWASDEDNIKQLNRCAKELVWRRRARRDDENRWKQFALGTYKFMCQHPTCHESSFKDQQGLDIHLMSHESTEEEGQYRNPSFETWTYQPRSNETRG